MNKPESSVTSAGNPGQSRPGTSTSIASAPGQLPMSKYQHGLSNIGIAMGFAKATGATSFALHQNACVEMALNFERTDQARAIEYDYEPVTVLYYLEPVTGAPPRRIAMHVCRMARSAVPKVFLWNSKRWAVNLEMYPFGSKYDQLSDSILESLADRHEWPQWVNDAADDDEELDALLNSPSRRGLHSRVLITGYVHFDDVGGARKLDDAHQHRIYLRQGQGLPALPMQMSNGTKGMQAVLAMAELGDPIPVTFLLKSLVTCTLSGPEVVESVDFDFDVLQAFAVTPWDIEPRSAPLSAPE